MQKKMILLIGIAIISSMMVSGCVSVEKKTRPRVDQNVSTGNAGFLAGDVPEEHRNQERPTEREIVRYDIQLFQKKAEESVVEPTLPEEESVYEITTPAVEEEVVTVDNDYTYEDTSYDEPEYETYEYKPEVDDTPAVDIGYYEEEETIEVAAPEYEEYVVKKGESLWDISKKVYGKGSLWKTIFDANTSVLKNPNKIREGMKLQIPQIQEETQQSSSVSGCVK